MDTGDLLVAGVHIWIWAKYLYLYLRLKVLTFPGLATCACDIKKYIHMERFQRFPSYIESCPGVLVKHSDTTALGVSLWKTFRQSM